MTKVRALLVSVALIASVFVFAPATSATVQSCSQASYNVYEYVGYTGDGLHVCYPVNFPDLRNVAHLQAGTCFTNAGPKTHDDWDDCLSSAQNMVGSEAHAICFYTGYTYAGTMTRLGSGQHVNFAAPMADTISSIKWC